MRASLMGTTAHVVVPGRDEMEAGAIERLHTLESRWSRFLAGSELSRVNRSGGKPVAVSDETATAIETALAAYTRTSGLFDPTIHDALVALGYDRTFEELPRNARRRHRKASVPVPGCAGIEVDRSGDSPAVTVPAGVALDLGGIGKGHAADIVLQELLAAGASGACVNIGGDLALAGEPPSSDGWIVGVEDPFVAGNEILRLALVGGAIATTSRLRRRWQRGRDELHHIVDPRTGRPAVTDTVAATVICGRAADADVLAKVALIDADAAAALLHEAGASAILIDRSRRVRCINGVEAYAA